MSEFNQSFSLDTDQLDAIRLEAQSVSPEKQKEFQNVVEEAYELFLKKFGKLFSQREIIPPGIIKDRFILVDQETMKMFVDTWEGTHQQQYSEDNVLEKVTKPYIHFLESRNCSLEPTNETLQEWLSSLSVEERNEVESIISSKTDKGAMYIAEGETGTFRAYHREGQFIVGIPIELWESINLQNKANITSQQGNEENAKKFVDRAIWLNLILHEITHLYQDDIDRELPLWLKELQAYWVGRELVDPDLQVSIPDFDKRADFFQSLIDEYPDLCQVIFDLNRGKNRFTLYSILKKVPEEKIKELFPDYREK